MTEVTSYYNQNAPVYRQWIAYVVMDNGNLWGVYAIGATQGAAEAKIKTLWDKERAKHFVDPWSTTNLTQQQRVGCMEDGPAMVDKQHHLAGLVWLIHKETREKKRVSPNDAEVMMISGNWEKGGPRSK